MNDGNGIILPTAMIPRIDGGTDSGWGGVWKNKTETLGVRCGLATGGIDGRSTR